MKKALVLLVFTMSAFANFSGALFVQGPNAGEFLTSTDYLGVWGEDSVCYVGNGWAVRSMLKEWGLNDYEKKDVSVWFNQDSEVIDFTYVDTKCTDEGESDEECTSTIEVPRC